MTKSEKVRKTEIIMKLKCQLNSVRVNETLCCMRVCACVCVCVREREKERERERERERKKEGERERRRRRDLAKIFMSLHF